MSSAPRYSAPVGAPVLAGMAACLLLGAPTVASASDIELYLTQEDDLERGLPLLRADEEGSVDFRLRTDFACAVGETASVLFVSVADTAMLEDTATSPRRFVVAVPAGRLAGVRRAAVCETAGPARLAEQLTAYATLQCRDEASGRVRSRTISQPLDLWYECPRALPDRPRLDEDSLRDD